MRRIALINQKGGVGKTTSTVNLGAALARAGRRVVLIDLDPQANLSLHLDVQLMSGEPSSYSVLLGNTPLASALRDARTKNLRLLPSCIDLSGAELELANAFGREMILRDALDSWEKEHRDAHGEAPADYVLLDCPPSLGLLSVNGLVAAYEAFIVVQTEFFALQGMTKLVDVVALLRRRLNPKLEVSGILPCLYDNRTRLGREVVAELRTFFPGRVFARSIAKSVKLAEAPSYGRTIFEYAPESSGAVDYTLVAQEVIAQEARDADLAQRYPQAAQVPVVIDNVVKPARKPKRAPVSSAPVGDDRQRDEAALEEAPRVAAPAEVPLRESKPLDRTSRDETLREVVIQPAPPTAKRTLNGAEPATATPASVDDELPELPPESELMESLGES